ncbi:MAG: PQQ-dependent sugar dehydrogenase [Anaerolineaceae bacterium]|nr:PQQ-dependent sugar dehydrogenase [Anaerolineaceae bacterium]
MKSSGLFLLLLLLTACQTANNSFAVSTQVAATVSALRREFWQPTLLEPANGARFASPAGVTLAWDWGRALAQDQHFDLRVWRPGAPQYGITWTRERNFPLTHWLTQQEAGEFHWSVAVIQGRDGQVEAEPGPAPPARSFILESAVLPTIVPTSTPAAPDPDEIATLPPGFTLQVFAWLRDAPTTIADVEFAPDGDLIALALDGRIFRLRDADGDGQADTQRQIFFNDGVVTPPLDWAVGMALRGEEIFISDEGRVGRLSDRDDDGLPDQYRLLVTGLPGRQYPFHSNNGIAFGPDGLLYIAVGSTSDHGPLRHPLEAGILRVDPEGGAPEVFASGFRNPLDLAFAPDGRLFSADNSPDLLDATLPFYPPEEINLVQQGADYGFPDVYGFDMRIRPVDRESEPPLLLLPTSSVSSGLTWYGAQHFPPAWRDGLYLAQFGGFNKQGKKVVFVAPDDRSAADRPVARTFADFHPAFRPVDVTVGPDGALYVVEWDHGLILRVTWAADTP